MVIENLLTSNIDTSGLEESITHPEDMMENVETTTITTAPEPLSNLSAQESGWEGAVIKTGLRTAKRVYEQEEIWQADNPIRSADLVYDKKIRLFENYTKDNQEPKTIGNLFRNVEFVPATIVTPKKGEGDTSMEGESDVDTSMEKTPLPPPPRAQDTPATGLRVTRGRALTTLQKSRNVTVIDDLPQTEPKKRVRDVNLDSALRMARGKRNANNSTPHRTFDWYDSSSFSPLESIGELAEIAAAKKGGGTAKKVAVKQRLEEVEEESEEESEEEEDGRILPSSSEDEKPQKKKQKKAPAARKVNRKEDSESDFSDEEEQSPPKKKPRRAAAPKGKVKKGKKNNKESDYSNSDEEEANETEEEDTPVERKPRKAAAPKAKNACEDEEWDENEEEDEESPAGRELRDDAATRARRGREIKGQSDASEIEEEEALPPKFKDKHVQKVAPTKRHLKKQGGDVVSSSSGERATENEDEDEDGYVEKLEEKSSKSKAGNKATKETRTRKDAKIKNQEKDSNSSPSTRNKEDEEVVSDQSERSDEEEEEEEEERDIQKKTKGKKVAGVRQLLAEKAFELQNKNKRKGALAEGKYGGFIPSMGSWFGGSKAAPAPPPPSSEFQLPSFSSKEQDQSDELIGEEIADASFTDGEASKAKTETSEVKINQSKENQSDKSEDDDDTEYYPITEAEIQELFQDFNKMTTKLEESKKMKKKLEEEAAKTDEKINKLKARLTEQMEKVAISQLELGAMRAVGFDKMDYLYAFARVERRKLDGRYDGRQLAKLDVETLERPPFASKLVKNPFHHDDMYQRRQIINNLTFPANVMMSEFGVKYTSPAYEKEMPTTAQGLEQLNDSKASENYEAWLYTKGIWNDYLKQSEDLKETKTTDELEQSKYPKDSTAGIKVFHQMGSVGLRAAGKRKREDDGDWEMEPEGKPKSKRQTIDERQEEVAEMQRRERRPPVVDEDEDILYGIREDDEVHYEDDQDMFDDFGGVHVNRQPEDEDGCTWPAW
ncbi:hypothetical protein AA313_de0206503 [Arthrobotrys entomopaga]|nr:hypothetical protein AA313_de0206503 [Arthrobotrys entomopaga]